MGRWKRLMMTLALVLGVGTVALPAANVAAIDVLGPGCKGNGGTSVCNSRGDDAAKLIKVIVNILLFVLGAIAVIMIIVGGVRYTTSNGDAGSVKGAKDTILYSVVGLVVAILAYAIVNFVVDRF